MDLFHSLFTPGAPIIEKIIRPVIVYFFVIISLRLAGKRVLAPLNAFDFVVLLLLSNVVQNAIIGEDNSVSGGIVGVMTLLSINYIMLHLICKVKWIRALLNGTATVLVKNGIVLNINLRKEIITLDELEIAAKKQGIHSIDDIETATLEPGGAITFLTKESLFNMIDTDRDGFISIKEWEEYRTKHK